jgi:hypothetical protein
MFEANIWGMMFYGKEIAGLHGPELLRCITSTRLWAPHCCLSGTRTRRADRFAGHAAEEFGKGGYRSVASERVDPDWTGDDVTDLGAIMDENPNYAAIGGVGPDLFFFLPDFRDIGRIRTASLLITVLDFLEKIYETIDPYIGKWEHFLGPISEDTAEEMSRLTGGLSETVGDISGELSGILTTLLEDFAVQQGGVLEKFSLGLDHGFDDKSFLWSDMLHYRATGQFGQKLWTNARRQKDPELWAYALGYLTHRHGRHGTTPM